MISSSRWITELFQKHSASFPSFVITLLLSKMLQGWRVRGTSLCIFFFAISCEPMTKKQRHYFVNKGPSSQGYGLSSGHVWMWELDYKENWAPKNWCFWTVVLEKTLESPLDCKEIWPVHPKGDQSWVFIGGTDVEAEAPIFWPLMWRADSFEKTLMVGKIEGRRRRGWQRMRW